MWILVKSRNSTGLTVVSLEYCLVPGREYSVGRMACDLVVESQAASRRHATIYVRERDDLINGSEVWIRDMSLRGTFVNSQKKHISEFQIFNGDEIVFGKWSCLSYAYTYILRWDPITLCYSRCVLSLPSIRDRVRKYDIAAVDSWDDSATHVVVDELRTSFKVLCDLSKGIPIVRQSWVDQMIRSIECHIPLPQPSQHMPNIIEASEICDVSLFQLNLKRKSLFEGKTFCFFNIQQYEWLRMPISYCGGMSTLVNLSILKSATPETCSPLDSVVVRTDMLSNQTEYQTISKFQDNMGRTTITIAQLISSIINVERDFNRSSLSTQSRIPPPGQRQRQQQQQQQQYTTRGTFVQHKQSIVIDHQSTSLGQQQQPLPKAPAMSLFMPQTSPNKPTSVAHPALFHFRKYPNADTATKETEQTPLPTQRPSSSGHRRRRRRQPPSTRQQQHPPSIGQKSQPNLFPQQQLLHREPVDSDNFIVISPVQPTPPTPSLIVESAPSIGPNNAFIVRTPPLVHLTKRNHSMSCGGSLETTLSCLYFLAHFLLVLVVIFSMILFRYIRSANSNLRGPPPQ